MNTVLFFVIGIPLIEIYLFIKIGSQIGAFNTLLLILITAVVGVAYARYEGFNTLKSGVRQLIKNEMPLYEMLSGMPHLGLGGAERPDEVAMGDPASDEYLKHGIKPFDLHNDERH